MSDQITNNVCGDNSCIFGPPQRLGTNGGCRCVGGMYPTKTRIGVTRNIQIMQKRITDLERQLAEAKLLLNEAQDERDALHKSRNINLQQLAERDAEVKQRREQIDAIRKVFVCASGRDGECSAGWCPQKKTYLNGCPLYDWDHDEEGNDIRAPLEAE